jgi:hypothetical protein
MTFTTTKCTILFLLIVISCKCCCIVAVDVNNNNNVELDNIVLLNSQLYQRNSNNNNNKKQQRVLQNNQTYCSVVYNKFVYSNSSYERSNTPCNCYRSSERLIETVDIDPVVIKRTIPGTFQVDCSYDYCSTNKCITTINGTTVCATRTTNSTYKEDIDNPNDTELMDGDECVQYTTTDNDDDNTDSQTVCKRLYFDFNVQNACEIQFGSQDSVFMEKCTVCKFVSCKNTGAAAGSYSNNLWQRKVAFDCTNINGLYAMDPCDYTETSNSTLYQPDPTIWSYDPLSWLNPLGLIRFDTCFDPNAPTSSMSPIKVPTNIPTKKPVSSPTSSTSTDTKPSTTGSNNTKTHKNTTDTTTSTNATTAITSNGFQSNTMQIQSFLCMIALTTIHFVVSFNIITI